MPASVEREVKLLAPDGFRLPAMDGAVPGLLDRPVTHAELDAVYFAPPQADAGRTSRSPFAAVRV